MSVLTAWLTPEEVGRLTDTGPRSYATQRKRLAEMGVPFEVSYSGKPLVLADAATRGKKRRVSAPAWDRLPDRAA